MTTDSERSVHALLDALDVVGAGALAADSEERVLAVNQTAAALLGESARGANALRRTLDEVLAKSSFSRSKAAFGGGSIVFLRDAMREQETAAFLDSVVENIPDMIFVKDAEDLRFRRFNRAGEELLGVPRDALLGKNDYDLFPKDQAEFFQAKDREVLAGAAVVDIPEEPIDTPRGRRWLHTKKIPISVGTGGGRKYLLGISSDITDRKAASDALARANEELERRVAERTAELTAANAALAREIEERQATEMALRGAEEQVRHSVKMDAIGRLAGGIAHDFNNLLSVIISYSSWLVEELQRGDPCRDDILEIKRAGERAAELTRQLLAFSRRQVLEPRVFSLNEVIANMDRMLQRVLGEDIELRAVPGRALSRVKADPGQIEQVIMNLAVNARDAMPSGGRLTLETANIELDDAYARTAVGVAPGWYVMLAVTDTGHGIPEGTRDRIFEPFYTTKGVGKGTGLGLSTVFGVVKQSGGHVAFYSEVGRGTTFKVYLPRVEDEADDVAAPPVAPIPHGTETILLVEDDASVRALARNILKRCGYQIIETQNAGEALLMCERFSGTIHLLLTDVVMPQVSGPEVAARLTALRPDLKVLFMSGYTDDAIIHHGVLEEGVAFLQKPITPESLARRVRAVLDAPLKREIG